MTTGEPSSSRCSSARAVREARQGQAADGDRSRSEPAAVDPVARVAGRPAAGAPRPSVRLPRAGDDGRRRAVPGARVKVRFAGQDVDGFVLERARAPTTPARCRRCAGWSAPSRCSPPRSPRCPARSPTATPAPAPTCCGWRFRRGTRRSRSEPRRAGPAASDRRRVGPRPGRALPGRCRAARAAGRGRVARARSGPRCPATTGPTLLAEAVVGDAASGTRRARLRARPPRRRPARRRAARRGSGAGEPRRAHRRPRPGRALPRLPRGRTRSGPGRRRHPRRGVRAGARPRAGGDLGRRRRPARRAAGAVPACPRGAAAARPGDRRCRRAGRRYARSVEAEYLVAAGWATGWPRRATSCASRRLGQHVTGDTDRDLDRDAARPARPAAAAGARACCATALERGPVLRAGAAGRLRRPGWRATAAARRPGARPATGRCGSRGPARAARCRWCATAAPGWQCPDCGGRGLRAPVVGDARTAEELGRAFPEVPGAHVVGGRPGARRRSTARPPIVVATPGAEPVADGGYAAVRAARHLAAAGARRPAADRGGAAPLGQRRRAGAPGRRGRPGARGRRALAPGACRRWCAGTRPGSPRRELAERAVGPPAAGLAGGDRHRRPPTTLDERAAAASTLPAGCRGAGPGPGRARRRARADGCSALRRAGAARVGAALSAGAAAGPGRPLRPQAAAPCGCRSTRPSSAERGAGTGAAARRLAHDRRQTSASEEPPLWPSRPHPPVRRPRAAHAGRAGRRLRQGAAHARRRT